MGLLNTSLQIGRSALMANSLAMDITGNNIANAATEGYARQIVDLQSIRGVKTVEGLYVGLGVNAESVRRITDVYLEQRLRDARSAYEGLKSQDETFQRLEGVFNELNDSDLSSVLNDFFTALNTLHLNPEDRSIRRAVVESAQTFTDTVRSLREGVDRLRTDVNSEIAGSVDLVNDITAQVADLNLEISQLEAGGARAGSATALRDRRDLLLGKLGDLLEVKVVELDSGMVNVFAGPDPLVMNNRSYALATEERLDNGVLVDDIVFASDSRPVALRGGRIAGMVEARDEDLTEFVEKLDAWTASLIDGFNRIHSGGVGLDVYQDITGVNGVNDPMATLNAAGLDFTPQTGTFEIRVKNATSGETKTFLFHVDLDGLDGNDTTLTSLVSDIDTALGGAYPAITATMGPGNTLRISSSASELSFGFADDTSGALACLGLNTFFTGSDSTTIGVNQLIDDNPGLIAAAETGLPGDNANAVRLMAFQRDPLNALGGMSVDSFYQGIVSTMGVRAAAAKDRAIGSQAILSALQNQREAVSGVSLDEEAVKLIRYQSGYRAAARFISTVDEMIQTLLAI